MFFIFLLIALLWHCEAFERLFLCAAFLSAGRCHVHDQCWASRLKTEKDDDEEDAGPELYWGRIEMATSDADMDKQHLKFIILYFCSK